MISADSWSAKRSRVNRWTSTPILKRAVMKGLVVNDFEDRRDAFLDEVEPWVASGRIRYREDRATGIENLGAHFARLMRGENTGKSLVVVGPEP